jgi:hypothetical protein
LRSHRVLVALAVLLGCRPEPNYGPEPDPFLPPPDQPEPVLRADCVLPTAEDLAADPVVRWAFERALYDSVVQEDAGTSREDAVTETGGWLRQCQTVDGAGQPAYYYDAVIVEGTPRNRTSIDLDDASYIAGDASCRTVGNFHVHPSQGSDEPSDSDVSNAIRRGMPAFVVSHESSTSPPYRFLPESWMETAYGGWTDEGKERSSWSCPPCDCDSDLFTRGGGGPATCPTTCSGSIVLMAATLQARASVDEDRFDESLFGPIEEEGNWMGRSEELMVSVSEDGFGATADTTGLVTIAGTTEAVAQLDGDLTVSASCADVAPCGNSDIELQWEVGVVDAYANATSRRLQIDISCDGDLEPFAENDFQHVRVEGEIWVFHDGTWFLDTLDYERLTELAFSAECRPGEPIAIERVVDLPEPLGGFDSVGAVLSVSVNHESIDAVTWTLPISGRVRLVPSP